jgi:integrase
MGEGLHKQAKVLTEGQMRAAISAVARRRYPERDRVMILLSVRAGLRAKEIAAVTWGMVTDAQGRGGTALHLTNSASKGENGGRTVPLNKELRQALIELKATRNAPEAGEHIVHSERDIGMSANAVTVWFHRLYSSLGFAGASSHHPMRKENRRGRRLAPRRPRACGSCVAADDAAVYSGRQCCQAAGCGSVMR